jgi:hypothetical protein
MILHEMRVSRPRKPQPDDDRVLQISRRDGVGCYSMSRVVSCNVAPPVQVTLSCHRFSFSFSTKPHCPLARSHSTPPPGFKLGLLFCTCSRGMCECVCQCVSVSVSVRMCATRTWGRGGGSPTSRKEKPREILQGVRHARRAHAVSQNARPCLHPRHQLGATHPMPPSAHT